MLTLVCAPASRSEASYPMAFPTRGDAFPGGGVYIRTEGHGSSYGSSWGIDFRASSWDGASWHNDDGGGTNEDVYIFGTPIYAPEDGEVIACWRKAPDKPSPDLHYDIDGDGVFGEAYNCVGSGAQCCPEDDDSCADFPGCGPDDSCGSGHDRSPLGAGNFLVIRNAVGDYITLFAHMKEHSIPSSVCPLPADRDDTDNTSSPGSTLPGPDGWPDDRTDTCNGAAGYYADTILPAPVPVRKGQLLGEVGHSGRSNAPHLHLHVKPHFLDFEGDYCEGPSEEISFHESWSRLCASGQAPASTWQPLIGSSPLEPYDFGDKCEDDADCSGAEVCASGVCTVTKPAHCFFGDPIGPQADHHDVGVNATNLEFTTHAHGDVIAYQSAGELRLRSYDLGSDGEIIDQDVELEAGVLDLALARPNGYRDVVASVRGMNGRLEHIPYMVSAYSGQIVRWTGNELTEGYVYQVDSTPSPAHDGFVVAVEDSKGELEVIDYHVSGSLEITRDYSGSGEGGPIDDVEITTAPAFDGVVTAELTSTGWMVLRSFSVPASGGVTAADTFTTFLSGSSVTIDTVPTTPFVIDDIVVTSVLQHNNIVRLDTWQIEDDGTIDWVEAATAGIASVHDVAAGASIAGDITIALRDVEGDFRMIGYDVGLFGDITRNGTRDLGAVTQTAIVASAAGGADYLVAARTDLGAQLHLLSYAQNFHGWF